MVIIAPASVFLDEDGAVFAVTTTASPEPSEGLGAQ